MEKGRPRSFSDFVSPNRRSQIPISSMSLSSTKASSLHSEDSSLLTSNVSFYCAIYEFCQGSFPKTIWECGTPYVTNPDSFKLFIINTPVTSCLSDYSEQTATMISSFENLNFIAVFFQVFDVEARGFTRSTVLVIAHSSYDVIIRTNHVFHNQILDFAKMLQSNSLKLFPSELKRYATSLKKSIDSSNGSKNSLVSKMDELKTILTKFDIGEINTKNAEIHPDEYFLVISNDIRPLEKLIDLDSIYPEIENFIYGLPNTRLSSAIVSDSIIKESPPSISFGPSKDNFSISEMPSLVFNSLDQGEEDYYLGNFLKNRLFFSCAYVLLSGQTLCIKSSSFECGLKLAKKFKFLCPFYREEHLSLFETITPRECLPYSIVITHRIEGETRSIINVLDLDTDLYTGDMCPPSSFVWQLGKCSDVSESAFILHVYSKLKDLSTSFVLALSESSLEIRDSPDYLMNKLKDVGFSKEDTPILNYWIKTCTNQQKLKPVLFKNATKGIFNISPF